MSAIAGLVRFDSEPVMQGELQCMLAAMAHRMPDGGGHWLGDGVGLAHGALLTTERTRESQPILDAASGLVLTADARIDNRRELMAALKTDGREHVTDSELVLKAYRKWGERCVEHLIGDFAFAVWDRPNRQLFCARDHFGVKPFYYHRKGPQFCFGSEIKSLLTLPSVPRLLNEVKVGDYLQRLFDDPEITFYEDVLRLPAAHTLKVSERGIAVSRYWLPDPNTEIHLRSEGEYSERFQELFLDAVRCRSRSAYPVAGMLSGGLDSSSIVCAARQVLRAEEGEELHTFSWVFDELRECDERPFIDAVLKQGGLISHRIHGDRISPMDGLDRLLRHDEPTWGFNLCLHSRTYQAATEIGARVVLDGLKGDDTVSRGLESVADLMRRGRLAEVAISVIRMARHHNKSVAGLFRKYALRPLTPPSFIRAWQTLRGTTLAEDGVRAVIAPAFAERIELVERLRSRGQFYPDAPATFRGSHFLGLLSGFSAATLEMTDRASADVGMEARYPFLDKRLVEFCLGLPLEQRFYRGWTRMIQRRGTAGLLPEEVRWRGGKGNIGAQFYRGFLRYERERIEEVVYGDVSVLEPYIDRASLRRLYADYLRGAERNALELWNPVMLALWLRHGGLIPSLTKKGGSRIAERDGRVGRHEGNRLLMKPNTR